MSTTESLNVDDLIRTLLNASKFDFAKLNSLNLERLREAVRVLNSRLDIEQPKIETKQLQVSFRKKLDWYTDLDTLTLPEVPTGEIKRNVDTLLDNIILGHLKLNVKQEITDFRFQVGGWERTIVVCGIQIEGSCAEYIDHGEKVHYDTINIPLVELRTKLKMPFLPLCLLMDIVLVAFCHSEVIDVDHHNCPDQQDSWPSIVAMEWGTLSAKDTYGSLVYGTPDSDIPNIAFEKKSQKWSILKDKRPHPLFYGDLLVEKYVQLNESLDDIPSLSFEFLYKEQQRYLLECFGV